jgi:ribonuclease BN (tRNA processing enzyme)
VTTVRFIGSGDAFGSGGRFQACILLEHDGFRALLDCGATSLVALRRASIDPGTIDAVIVTHYHGDHSGGVPYLILDGQFTKRTRALVIAGPPPAQQRIATLFEAALPTSSSTAQTFGPRYLDLGSEPTAIGPLTVAALPVDHLPETEPRGLRIGVGGRTIAYTGDTAWCDALPKLADASDLLIAECYTFTKAIPRHLSHADLIAHRADLGAKRIVLTHPGPEALSHRSELAWDLADDGLELQV